MKSIEITRLKSELAHLEDKFEKEKNFEVTDKQRYRKQSMSADGKLKSLTF